MRAMAANALPEPVDDVAERVARRTAAKRGPDYTAEVRRLLDAGLEVIRECGTDSRPRVADIVAAAGLSNDAFYRHFASKDDLVAAILDDGAERLGGYLAHQMAKARTPEGQVRRWVEGILRQADDDIAPTTIGVLANAGARLGGAPAAARGPLAAPLQAPFAALGSRDPALDASLAAHATVGKLGEYLSERRRPARAEVEHIVKFCLRVAGSDPDLRASEKQE
jgi:AcrR family transcriptional regulator